MAAAGNGRNEQIMSEGKKSGWARRRAYLDDFRRTADGEYIYIGATYVCRESGKERRRCLALLSAVTAVMLAAAVTGGCIHVPGTLDCAYVLLPYMLSLLASCSLAWALVRILWGRGSLRAYVYNATIKQIPLRTLLAAGGAGASILGELIYVLLHGTQGLASGMALFLLFHGLILAGALAWRTLAGRLHWEERSGWSEGAEN